MTEPGLHMSAAGRGLGLLFFPGVLVSLASGERLLVAASLIAGAALLVSWTLAMWDLRGLVVDAQGPDVATVGRVVSFRLTATRRRQRMRPEPAAVDHVFVERGIVHALPVPMTAMSPLGLIGVVRSLDARLAGPVHVGPAPIATPVPPIPAAALTASGIGDEATGVRPFVAGDRARDVHWATTARTGGLHVRDRPAAVGAEVAIVVDATAGPMFERALGQARHLAGHLLATGYRVTLSTGDRIGRVASDDDGLRRLAKAEPGDPTSPPELPAITFDGA